MTNQPTDDRNARNARKSAIRKLKNVRADLEAVRLMQTHLVEQDAVTVESMKTIDSLFIKSMMRIDLLITDL